MGFAAGLAAGAGVMAAKQRMAIEDERAGQEKQARQIAIDQATQEREFQTGMREAGRVDEPRAQAILNGAIEQPDGTMRTADGAQMKMPDPEDGVAQSLKQQMAFALSKGRAPEAQALFEKYTAFNQERRTRAMDEAERRFAVDKDYNHFTAVYNRFVDDGGKINAINRQPNGMFMVSGSMPGRGEFNREFDEKGLTRLIGTMRDPGAMRKVDAESARELFKSTLKVNEQLTVENVKQAGENYRELVKANRLTPEQQQEYQHILSARSYLSGQGITDVAADPRLQEYLPGGIRNDKFSPLLADMVKRAMKPLPGEQVDQQLAAVSTTPGQPGQMKVPAPPAPGQPAAPGQAIPTQPQAPGMTTVQAPGQPGAVPGQAPGQPGAAPAAAAARPPMPQGAPQGTTWAKAPDGTQGWAVRDPATKQWSWVGEPQRPNAAPAAPAQGGAPAPAGKPAEKPGVIATDEEMSRKARLEQAQAIDASQGGGGGAIKATTSTDLAAESERRLREGVSANAERKRAEKDARTADDAKLREELANVDFKTIDVDTARALRESDHWRVMSADERRAVTRAVTASGERSTGSMDAAAQSLRQKIAEGKALSTMEAAQARALERKKPGTFSAEEKQAFSRG